jgi:hypothetical protein
MMNFYCSEKHDKTNRFNSDWGTIQNKIENLSWKDLGMLNHLLGLSGPFEMTDGEAA